MRESLWSLRPVTRVRRWFRSCHHRQDHCRRTPRYRRCHHRCRRSRRRCRRHRPDRKRRSRYHRHRVAATVGDIGGCAVRRERHRARAGADSDRAGDGVGRGVDHRHRGGTGVGDIGGGTGGADRHPERRGIDSDGVGDRGGRCRGDTVGASPAVSAVAGEQSPAPAITAVDDDSDRVTAIAAVTEPARRPAVAAVITGATVAQQTGLAAITGAGRARRGVIAETEQLSL